MTPSDSGNATISILEVTEVVNGIGNHVHQTNFVFSCISIVINLFHLLVLSRKSMKTSSTNIILIGLSISDLCIMLTTVYKHYLMTDQESSDCVTADTRVKVYLDLSIWSIQTIFRRCGCWLGVLMATVRFIIVKKLTLSRYGNWSEPRVGWVMVFVVFCISSIQTIFSQSRWLVVENRSIPLPVNCAEYQNIHITPQYSVMLTPFFSFNDQIVLRSYTMFDAIVTKFIPCFAFPVLTIALLRVLRKMKEAGGSSGRSSSGEEKKELTTKLIVFMTIAFFITEAPLGGIYLVKALYDRNDPITLLSTDLVVYFSMLVTINSILHPVFCVMMSSQYRNTIRRMCGVKPAAKMSSARNKTSVVSVQGIQMT
uniref:G_PROTEIN_RECEP_F1_2 domain-containing protein n=1 Tax=Caenorhabditis tropicalis TaxID=1561998 RepID=A0A1I7V2K7_9PELO